jgi:phage-related tail fiber protein
MIKTRYIGLVTLLIMTLVMLSTSESYASCIDACHTDVTHECHDEDSSHSIVTLGVNNSVALAVNPTTTQNVTPIVRTTLRTNNGIERAQQYTRRTTAAIDNTTTAARYGLYNHKILFVSTARHHYVCRLRRLII